jgi:DNA-binding transcriptional regulator LsrR (DeoR family)
MSQRWADYRESNRERDEKIVTRYKEGLSHKDLALEFGISKTTVQKIVKEAANEGRVTIRPRNYALSRPGVR